jgi:hypothetical protein
VAQVQARDAVVRTDSERTERRRRGKGGRGVAPLLLAGFMAVFVVLAWGRIAAPFGDSHDGRNAAVWATGSRALRTHGPVASRLGARLSLAAGASAAYVDHPPLTYWETAAAEEALGVRPWSSRAPAWAGTLLAMVLLYLLLQECGLSAVASAAGVALGFGCPMIGLYGAMLDSWVVGLPWAVGSLLVWQRERAGRPCRGWVVAAVTAGTVLSSWLGALTVAAIATTDAAQAARSHRAGTTGRARLIAVGAAVAAVGAWMLWAAGSFQGVWSAVVSRTGAGRSAIGAGIAWASVRSAWSDLLTPWQVVLGLPIVIAAVVSRRTRPVLVVALASLVVWTALFRNGATIHDYWTLWIVVPLALGFAVALDAVARAWGRVGSVNGVVPVVAVTVAVGCLGLAQLSVAQVRVRDGQAAATVVQQAHYLRSQPAAWYVGDLVQPVDWISYLTRRPARQLVTAQDVYDLAERSPDDVVLAGGDKAIRTNASRSCPVMFSGPPFSTWTSQDLANLLRHNGC